MKKLLALALGVAQCVYAQVNPRPATLDEVNAGVNTKAYVSPYTLQNSTFVPGTGINNTEASNIAYSVSRTMIWTNLSTLRTNVRFTVSGRGIIGGRSSVSNNYAAFGPDTPGTTTSGLQEAWNAAYKGVEYGPTTAFAILDCADYMYFTNALVFSNQYSMSVVIKGNDPVSTKFVYAGNAKGISTVLIRGGHNPTTGSLDIPMDVTIRDVGFTSLVNTTNILLTITNSSNELLDNCYFTSWQIMTNQVWGSQRSIAGGAPYPVPGLVGCVVGNVNDSWTKLQNCKFAGLAVGAHVFGDHFLMYDPLFSVMAQASDFSGTTLWETNYVYSSGASILRNPGLKTLIFNPDFYTCTAGFVYNNALGQSEPIHIYGMEVEACDFAFAAVQTTNCTINLDAIGSHSVDWTNFCYVRGLAPSPYDHSHGVMNIRRAVYDGTAATANDVAEVINSAKFTVGPIQWTAGSGSPEGAVTAPVGSFYSRTNGSTSTTWYVKETGTGNTGWVAK